MKSSALVVPSTSARIKHVTVKDVALHAGVSHSAVSMVLNGAKSGNVAFSDATRARILVAAEELGYRRNGSMSAAKSGRFNAVGLLISTERNRSYLPPELLQGVSEGIRASDLHLILQQLPDEKLIDAAYVPKMLREWMCDGLLIDYTHAIPPALLELIHRSRTPAIWINVKLDADCVHPDDFGAGKQAAEHLLKLGHRRIAYSSHFELLPLSPLPHYSFATHYSVFDRREGCKAAVEGAGLPFEVFAVGRKWPYEQRVGDWVEKLKSPGRPTGIVVYGGLDCSVVLHAAEIAGLRVPQDLSIVMFNSEPYERYGQRVTMLTIPQSEIGHAAVERLLQKIEQPECNLAPLALPFDLDPGATCAPAPSQI